MIDTQPQIQNYFWTTDPYKNYYQFNKQIVGRCSKCNGLVTKDYISWSTVPAAATCSSCGAMEKTWYDKLPVIDMK